MKVFVDECVNYTLIPHLRESSEHDFRHALDTRFAGLSDNVLLPLVDPLYSAEASVTRAAGMTRKPSMRDDQYSSNSE